jgi:hypothetical protein
MNGFNKCPNGHYYQGSTCPYCPQTATTDESNTSQTSGGDAKTQLYSGGNAPTQGDNKTQIVGLFGETADYVNKPNNNSNRTVFGDTVEIETASGAIKEEQQYRSTRRLVGWLVTYSFDKMGIDFKLYEGRNIIGRDSDCNITVNDNMISGKHAILLFRADRYSLTDSQSTHGTFVNDEDIALEPRYISDGDVIRMGQTVFKFRTSLF